MMKTETHLDSHGSWIWRSPDPSQREPNLILFIHGYTGAPAATWGRFPDLVRHTGQGFESGFEVAAFGYQTNFLFNRLGVETFSELLYTFLETEVDPKSSLFIVTHSLGGLIARHLLVRSGEIASRQGYLDRTRQVHFVGVPHLGARFLPRLFRYLPFLNRIAAQAHHRSAFLRDLLERWGNLAGDRLREGRSLPALHHYVGARDWVAPLAALGARIDELEHVHVGDADHVGVVKPENPRNTFYQLITRSIRAASGGSLVDVRPLSRRSTPSLARVVAKSASPDSFTQHEARQHLATATDEQLLALMGLYSLGADDDPIPVYNLAVWSSLAESALDGNLAHLEDVGLVTRPSPDTVRLGRELAPLVRWLFYLDDAPGMDRASTLAHLRERLGGMNE